MDILTIDDVTLEVRVGLIMRRRRKEMDHKLAINKLLMDMETVHALDGWPERLALPEVTA